MLGYFQVSFLCPDDVLLERFSMEYLINYFNIFDLFNFSLLNFLISLIFAKNWVMALQLWIFRLSCCRDRFRWYLFWFVSYLQTKFFIFHFSMIQNHSTRTKIPRIILGYQILEFWFPSIEILSSYVKTVLSL